MSTDRSSAEAAAADQTAFSAEEPKKQWISPQAKGALKAMGVSIGIFGLVCAGMYGMNYAASRGAAAGVKDSGLDLSKLPDR